MKQLILCGLFCVFLFSCSTYDEHEPKTDNLLSTNNMLISMDGVSNTRYSSTYMFDDDNNSYYSFWQESYEDDFYMTLNFSINDIYCATLHIKARPYYYDVGEWNRKALNCNITYTYNDNGKLRTKKILNYGVSSYDSNNFDLDTTIPIKSNIRTLKIHFYSEKT